MTPAAVATEVTTWACTCAKCGHAWQSIGPERPKRCAGCKAPNWDRPRLYVQGEGTSRSSQYRHKAKRAAKRAAKRGK